MKLSRRLPLLRACTALVLAPVAAAQNFVFAPDQIPQGAPANSSYAENIDFADVDMHGDMDAINADGSDIGDDQNRLWINMGFAQSGTIKSERCSTYSQMNRSTTSRPFGLISPGSGGSRLGRLQSDEVGVLRRPHRVRDTRSRRRLQTSRLRATTCSLP